MSSERRLFLIVFCHCLFFTVLSLYREETLVVVKENRQPYLVRHLKHVYYVGTMDNGTLSCDITGAVKYKWRGIGKEVIADGNYVNSWEGQFTSFMQPSCFD